jgi:multiple sugar transport system ATP-binding protein
MTLADRVVVLRDGNIEQVGSPLELYDHPANQFVAQFIGMPSMNLVPAKAVPSFAVLAQDRLPSDGSFGVRPEGVHIVSKGQGRAQGKVELIEALGSDTLIYINVAGQTLTARQRERTTLALGTDVGVEIDPALMHVFNAQGQAVVAA